MKTHSQKKLVLKLSIQQTWDVTPFSLAKSSKDNYVLNIGSAEQRLSTYFKLAVTFP